MLEDWLNLTFAGRFLLMTTHNNQKNEEQHGGRFRPVNFFKEPFCLDAPLCIAEDTKLGTLYIMLIDLRSIKDLVYWIFRLMIWYGIWYPYPYSLLLNLACVSYFKFMLLITVDQNKYPMQVCKCFVKPKPKHQHKQ